MEIVINYNTGEASAFVFSGEQAGWNGGLSGTIYEGFITGLGNNNSNYSKWFTGVSGSWGPFGLFTNTSPDQKVKPSGFSLSQSMLGKSAGSVGATYDSKPLPAGGLFSLDGPPASAMDYVFFVARQFCQSLPFSVACSQERE